MLFCDLISAINSLQSKFDYWPRRDIFVVECDQTFRHFVSGADDNIFSRCCSNCSCILAVLLWVSFWLSAVTMQSELTNNSATTVCLQPVKRPMWCRKELLRCMTNFQTQMDNKKAKMTGNLGLTCELLRRWQKRLSIEHILWYIGWLCVKWCNERTAFAKAPNGWTQIEHNMRCRRAARSSLWWWPYSYLSA